MYGGHGHEGVGWVDHSQDILVGGDDGNLMNGGYGIDLILGGAGSDTLLGGGNYGAGDGVEDILIPQGGPDSVVLTYKTHWLWRDWEDEVIGCESHDDIKETDGILRGYILPEIRTPPSISDFTPCPAYDNLPYIK